MKIASLEASPYTLLWTAHDAQRTRFILTFASAVASSQLSYVALSHFDQRCCCLEFTVSPREKNEFP